MEFASAPETFTGHFDVFPPNDVLLWNIHVPEERDFKNEFLGAAMVMGDEHFPRGADTLAALTWEQRKEYAELFDRLGLRFSYECEQGEFELVPSGKDIIVNEKNYLDYLARLEALYSCFHAREIAFALLEDNAEALLPLVPPQIQHVNTGGGRFDQIYHSPNGHQPLALTWVKPGEIEYTSVLPLPMMASSPPENPTAGPGRYTPCFLFCRMGSCIVERCVGWAPLVSALELQRHLARQGSADTPHSHSQSSAHLRNIRQLRNGSLRQPPPMGSSRGDCSLSREEEERVKSEYMRQNAIPIPCTSAERALFSPTHESGGIFAPIQPLTL